MSLIMSTAAKRFGKTLLAPSTLLLALAAGGCADQSVAAGEIMVPEASPRAADRVFLAQIATGAGEDAMLYNHHFDGAELNSLGTHKLRLMLEDAQFLADPNIYVVSGNAEQMAAVRLYLADWGIVFEDTNLHAGVNPKMNRSAAMGLLDRDKFEQAEVEQAAADSGSSATSQ
jgi:hypothetical protein